MCVKIIKFSVSNCCLVCCLRSTKNRVNVKTKLPFLALQGVPRMKASSGQGRVLRAICTAAVFTGFACDRREARCKTAVSSPPLQQNILFPQKHILLKGAVRCSEDRLPTTKKKLLHIFFTGRTRNSLDLCLCR